MAAALSGYRKIYAFFNWRQDANKILDGDHSIFAQLPHYVSCSTGVVL